MLKFLRLFLLLVGITSLLVGGYLFWEQNKPNKYRFEDFKSFTNAQQTLPSYLTYKEISLPITSSKIDDGKWPLSNDSITYLEDSGTIGKAGNAVIYGHNWKSLLGFLKQVKTGEKIRVTTGDNQYFDYSVELIEEVTPDQTHVLSPSEDARLTLYTCSGFMDKKRLVVVAKLTQ